jgi:hypothetical protein
MRVDDDEVEDLTALRNEDGASPEKKRLLGNGSETPISASLFPSPFDQGNGLPGIFGHKPKLDPKMLMTPSKANNVKFPKI